MSDLHPDVELAIQHRETRQMIQELREREQEIDLQAAMRDLAEIAVDLCRDYYLSEVAASTDYERFKLYRRAKALNERLS